MNRDIAKALARVSLAANLPGANTRLILPAAAAALWALTFLPGVWGGTGGWIVRVVCLGLWFWFAVSVVAGPWKRPAAATPLFLIVTLALWLYAIMPVVYASALAGEEGGALWRYVASISVPALFPKLIDSEGELAVLRFSLAGIAASAWVSPLPSAGGEIPPDERAPLHWIVLGLGLSAVVAYALTLRFQAGSPDGAGIGFAGQIKFIAQTVSVAMAALAAVNIVAGKIRAKDAAVFLAAGAGLILCGGLKLAVYLLGAVGLAFALRRKSVPIVVAAVALPLILLVVGMTARHPGKTIAGAADHVGRVISAKLVFRQVESVNCLTGVVRAHAVSRGESSNPFYFAAGLVPRALWPDKPDLSQSGRTVIRYCDPVIQNILARNPAHSASATLLWEPLAFAGLGGQIAAQILTFAILIVLTRLWTGGGPYAAAGALSLLPWAINFDQHFALYIAVLAKAGLIAGAVLVLSARLQRARLGSQL